MIRDHLLKRRDILAAGGLGAVALATGAIAKPIQSSSPGSGARIEPGPGRIPVAFVMDDAATMIDFAGPWEVFQDAFAANVPGFELYTVASTRSQLQTTGFMSGTGANHTMKGMKFNADYIYADAPQPRIIVMGAQVGRRSKDKLDWIRSAAAQADIVMSICTGAFILASTGLLDGLEATTHHNFFDSFERDFPNVKLVRGTRFVDNGKYVTSGGLTAGIDSSLHVLARYYGQAAALEVAKYMEYESRAWMA